MGKQLQLRRLVLMAVALVVAFAGMAFRLVDLQVLRHEELTAKAHQYTKREMLLEPRRGDILDVKGNPLATSVFVKTVFGDPSLVFDRQKEIARALAPILEVSEPELEQKLTPRVTFTNNVAVTNKYVVLKRKVPAETWERVQQAMRDLPLAGPGQPLTKTQLTLVRQSVQTEQLDDQLRVYPNQTLAAHVLGYVGMSEEDIDGTRILKTSGKYGIELTFDTKLSGVRGWRLTQADRRGRELITGREYDVRPKDGVNVALTIDSVIQSILESALAEAVATHEPVSASGIVVRPRTGEILAMATLPNFDPNNLESSHPEHRRNRIISDRAEPGSTFKTVVVSAALNEGVVRLSDVFDCEHGHFFFAGKPLRDHGSYGALTVQQIIAKSSNIGAAKIGIRLGADPLHRYLREFGFGTRTGIPLPGEVSAYVPPVKSWYKISIAQIPMGHGVDVTPLQITMAIAAIANGGVLMRPMLVDRLEDRDHRVLAKYTPQRVRQVIGEAAAADMVKAMKTVVTTNGTAPKAALEHYVVAGKTGTAQKVVNGSYSHDHFFSSFIGFLPADHPELCIAIFLDDPRKQGYYGSQAAAPVFKEVAERAANYLNIRPEINLEPAPTDTPVAPGRTDKKETLARSP